MVLFTSFAEECLSNFSSVNMYIGKTLNDEVQVVAVDENNQHVNPITYLQLLKHTVTSRKSIFTWVAVYFLYFVKKCPSLWQAKSSVEICTSPVFVKK